MANTKTTQGYHSNDGKTLKEGTECLFVVSGSLVMLSKYSNQQQPDIIVNTQNRRPKTADYWEQRKLGNITESFSGGTPSVTNSAFYGGAIPFIRSAEIHSDTTELSITEEAIKSSSAKMVHKGDILYALYGATSGQTDLSKIDGAINQAILALRPTKNVHSEYLVQWLAKEKETIISRYLQGGQGNLSASIVKQLIIPMSVNELENKAIGNLFQHLDDVIALHQRSWLKPTVKKNRDTLTKMVFVCVYK